MGALLVVEAHLWWYSDLLSLSQGCLWIDVCLFEHI